MRFVSRGSTVWGWQSSGGKGDSGIGAKRDSMTGFEQLVEAFRYKLKKSGSFAARSLGTIILLDLFTCTFWKLARKGRGEFVKRRCMFFDNRSDQKFGSTAVMTFTSAVVNLNKRFIDYNIFNDAWKTCLNMHSFWVIRGCLESGKQEKDTG